MKKKLFSIVLVMAMLATTILSAVPAMAAATGDELPILTVTTDRDSYDYGDTVTATFSIAYPDGTTEGLEELYADVETNIYFADANGEYISGTTTSFSGISGTAEFTFVDAELKEGTYYVYAEQFGFSDAELLDGEADFHYTRYREGTAIVLEDDINVVDGQDVIVDVSENNVERVVFGIDAFLKIYEVVEYSGEDLSLIIKYSDSTLTLDAQTVETLAWAAQAMNYSVEICCETEVYFFDDNDFSVKAWIRFLVNGEEVTEIINDGKIKVAIPYELPDDVDTESFLVNSNGKMNFYNLEAEYTDGCIYIVFIISDGSGNSGNTPEPQKPTIVSSAYEDDSNIYGFGDTLPYFYIYHADSSWHDASATFKIIDSNGNVVLVRDVTIRWWSELYADYEELFDYDDDESLGNGLSILSDEMKAAPAGDYTLIFELSTASDMVRSEYAFHYTGWNQAEPSEILIIESGYFAIGDGRGQVSVLWKLVSKDGLPAQGVNMTVIMYDENGNVYEGYPYYNAAFSTSSDGVLAWSALFGDTELWSNCAPYGRYTWRFVVTDNEDIFTEITFVITADEEFYIVSDEQPDDSDVIGADDVTIEDGKDIVIDVSDTEAESVEVGVDALDKIYAALESDKDISLVIKFANAIITMDKTAVKALIDAAGTASDTVTLTVKNIEASDLNEAQQKALKDEDVYVYLSLEAWVGDKLVSDFGGGKVTVSVAFELPEGVDAGNVKVAYVAEDGTVTAMPTTYADGVLTFETTHFSDYVVLAQSADDSNSGTGNEDVPQTGDSSNLALCVILMILSAAGIVTLYTRKRITSR